MSLLEKVNYYYVSSAELAQIGESYSEQDLLDAGLSITVQGIADLYNDFANGTTIGDNHYVGEDHINFAEMEFLNALEIRHTWYVGESSQKNGVGF